MHALQDKNEPHFWTGSTAAFQAAARIESIYVELRVLAAQMRINFLHSQLFRWGYGELQFYQERWSVLSERRCTLDRIKMNLIFLIVSRLLLRQSLESGHFTLSCAFLLHS